MKNLMTRLVGGLVAAVILVAIGGLSQFRWEAEPGDTAMVTFAWRARSTRVQECRVPTAEELEGVPVHMRQAEICEGRVLAYHLAIDLDSIRVVDDTVHGSGAREDRPVFVFYEFPVEPGTYEVNVEFVREDGGEVQNDNMALTPWRLLLSERISLEEGQISLVTYDPESRSLIVEGYGSE